LVTGESEVGGGSFPGAKLPTWLVAIRHPAPDTLVGKLRGGEPPVIARIADDRVVLDPRTILPDQINATVRAVTASLTSDG
jgi:L-seryl-tRNA(Ser) seleniumtransferase